MNLIKSPEINENQAIFFFNNPEVYGKTLYQGVKFET